jgi:hypothetical protein
MRGRKNTLILQILLLLGMVIMIGCGLITVETPQPTTISQATQTATALAQLELELGQTQAAVAATQTEMAATQTEIAFTVTATSTNTPMFTRTPATPTLCEVLYDFESDSEGWERGSSGDCSGGLELGFSDDGVSLDGQGSLRLKVDYPGGGAHRAACAKRMFGSRNWSDFESVSVGVYVPREAAYLIAQLYLKAGPHFDWWQTPDIYLDPGQWTILTAEFGQLREEGKVDLTDLREVGIRIGTSQTEFQGDIYIDHISGCRQ